MCLLLSLYAVGKLLLKYLAEPVLRKIRVFSRGMAAHELPLLSEICWFNLSESEVLMNMMWLAICLWCSMWHIASSQAHEKPSSARFPESAIIWSPRKVHHTRSLLITWTQFLKLHCEVLPKSLSDKWPFCTKKTAISDNRQTINASLVIHYHIIDHNENSLDIIHVQ